MSSVIYFLSFNVELPTISCPIIFFFQAPQLPKPISNLKKVKKKIKLLYVIFILNIIVQYAIKYTKHVKLKISCCTDVIITFSIQQRTM